MMKKHIFMAAVAAAILTACAQAPKSGLNDASKAYLEAWIKVNHPDAEKTPMGAYILEDIPGDGEALGDPEDTPYIRLDYVAKDLDGNILSTNSEALCKQLGTYEEVNFYGPAIWGRENYGVEAGLEEALSTMNIGGERTLMIPGWLMSSTEYEDADEYFEQASGTDAIYTIKPLERIMDIVQWEIDSLCSYMSHNYPQVSLADSLKNGFYYVRTGEPADTCGFHKDTTIYINYIGRLLNGTVFDTNIADTAKFYGIYDSSTTYEPKEIDCEEDYTETTMSSSSVIDGFAYTIYQMHSFEKGTGIFYSAYGYTTSGSGETIPPCSPLRFDIEVVEDE